MNYYINEYSLRGQFRDVDEFYNSLRDYTIPVLKKIESFKDNVIWKKDDLWNAKICTDVTLNNIPKKKNERSPERAILQAKLIKLIYEQPHWSELDGCDVVIKEYKFDDEYKDRFHKINCFIKGLIDEGRIISFQHNSYKLKDLELLVERNKIETAYCLDNIYSIDWWISEPEICTWYIGGKYKVEIRAKEIDYHPPHFHVSYNEYAAVFTLRNGELYRHGKKELLHKDLVDIYNWYEDNKSDLLEAWDKLHTKA